MNFAKTFRIVCGVGVLIAWSLTETSSAASDESTLAHAKRLAIILGLQEDKTEADIRQAIMQLLQGEPTEPEFQALAGNAAPAAANSNANGNGPPFEPPGPPPCVPPAHCSPFIPPGHGGTPPGQGGNNGNNGVGNGVDPPPPGNPPINDGPGTGPGNPGN